MSKAVFALANILFRYFYPVYRFVYYLFKRKQDAFEILLLKRFIRPGDVVLDIGANVGFYSETMAAIVGKNGEVHAFEPDPTNFRHLVSSTHRYKNIISNNMAVSNQTGELKLFTSNLLNVDHRSYPIDNFGTSFLVKADAIDNYLNGKKINFIKMDIQGAEFYALAGMNKTLDLNPEIKILTEFWPFGLKESGSSVDKFQEFLKSKGFLFYIIQDENLINIIDLSDYREKPEREYFNLILTRKAL